MKQLLSERRDSFGGLQVTDRLLCESSTHRSQLELGQEVVALRLGQRGSPWVFFENQGQDPPTPSMLGQEVFPVYALTSGGLVVGCDAIVSALGVEPAKGPVFLTSSQTKGLEQEDGWLAVDCRFRASEPGVYAAGDGCEVDSSLDRRCPEVRESGPTEWLQMRLWSQAKTMGQFAARNMIEDWESGGVNKGQAGWTPYPADPSMSSAFPFQLFTHVTRFFGFRVILLGR